MRETCLDCVRKHIGQASILLDESCLGYPHHKYFAYAHLAEAESESLREYPLLAQEIRAFRMALMNGTCVKYTDQPTFDQLMIKVCKIAGDELDFDPQNSKHFDYAKEGRK